MKVKTTFPVLRIGRLFCHHRLGFGFQRRYRRFLCLFRLGISLRRLLFFFSRLRLLGLFPLALLLQQSLAVLPTEMQIYGQPQAAQHDDDPSLTIQNESPLLLEVGFGVENGRAGTGFPGADTVRVSRILHDRRDGVITTTPPRMTVQNPANPQPAPLE